MADEQTKPPYNRKPIVQASYDWVSLLAKEGEALETQYRRTLEHLGTQPGMLGEVFKQAKPEIQNHSSGDTISNSEKLCMVSPELWQPFEVPGLDLRGSRWRADRLRVRPGQQARLVRGEERVRCDHDRPPARRRREVFGAGVGAGFGSRGGDSARTGWTKDGPAGPDAIGSPWVLTGGDSGVGTALHGTPP